MSRAAGGQEGRPRTHPAATSACDAARYISAASPSLGSGDAPGVYHLPNAVPFSTCRS